MLAGSTPRPAAARRGARAPRSSRARAGDDLEPRRWPRCPSLRLAQPIGEDVGGHGCVSAAGSMRPWPRVVSRRARARRRRRPGVSPFPGALDHVRVREREALRVGDRVGVRRGQVLERWIPRSWWRARARAERGRASAISGDSGATPYRSAPAASRGAASRAAGAVRVLVQPARRRVRQAALEVAAVLHRQPVCFRRPVEPLLTAPITSRVNAHRRDNPRAPSARRPVVCLPAARWLHRPWMRSRSKRVDRDGATGVARWRPHALDQFPRREGSGPGSRAPRSSVGRRHGHRVSARFRASARSRPEQEVVDHTPRACDLVAVVGSPLGGVHALTPG